MPPHPRGATCIFPPRLPSWSVPRTQHRQCESHAVNASRCPGNLEPGAEQPGRRGCSRKGDGLVASSDSPRAPRKGALNQNARLGPGERGLPPPTSASPCALDPKLPPCLLLLPGAPALATLLPPALKPILGCTWPEQCCFRDSLSGLHFNKADYSLLGA